MEKITVQINDEGIKDSFSEFIVGKEIENLITDKRVLRCDINTADVIEFIINTTKKKYFTEVLKKYIPDKNKFEDVTSLLADFDYFSDAREIADILKSNKSDVVSLDGIIHFRLGELKQKWESLGKMAINNAFNALE